LAYKINICKYNCEQQSVRIPVLANGDICSLSDAASVRAATGVDGVMVARGMLENPAMFAGHSDTPAECVSRWLRISSETGTAFTCFHHHLIYMCEKLFPRAERKVFNTLGSTAAVLEFLERRYDIRPASRVKDVGLHLEDDD
jgi:tRNA-dihydrouridine synthase 4